MASIGINTNNDATATTQGVPSAANPEARREGDINDALAADTIGSSEKGIDEKSASAADTLANEDEDSEMERRNSAVQALARSYSHASGVASGNPFSAPEDSPLNPNGPNFSGREWAKAMVEMIASSNNGKADFRSTGVCFQNMNVFGFGTATDYQKDVANVWLRLAGMASGAFGNGGKQRIDILRQFDGLVHKGEMLVVLGPPGSGCSTFLKTIAGEMNGIYVDPETYFNYQGKFKPHVSVQTAGVVR
jgi:ATP-binding cassette subfamily G (WHITE) protein 2 (PDR)